MKIVLLTNMPSYHQIELGEEFVELLGADNFRLVFYGPTSDARLEMGWQDEYSQQFILRYWQSEAARDEVRQWIDEADVVIQGRFPVEFVKDRISSGKLTFAYQERYWKKRFSIIRFLTRLPTLYKQYWSVNCKNYHLLAAGVYVAPDLNSIGIFRNRSWRFGYFVKALPYRAIGEQATLSLLWCARFSELKQPQHALQIAAALKKKQIPFKLTMVGDGELREEIQNETALLTLTNDVEFVGWQSEQSVFKLMEQAHVFLMNSDFREGWGLVVNEAMARGCAVVANKQVGSATWLIKDGVNGLLYSNDDVSSIAERVTTYTQEQWLAMGKQANESHNRYWSAGVAAQRIIKLSEALISSHSNNEPESMIDLYKDGPCSSV